MTIQTQTPRVVIIGNGTRGPYSLVDGSSQPMRFVSTSHLKLTRYAASTTANSAGTVLTENTDYTVGGTQDARTFTLASGQDVLTSSQRILAERVQSYTQDLDLTTGGAFNAAAVETRFDKIAEFQQELKAQLARAPKLQFADSTADVAFPSPPTSATVALGRNTSGAIVHLTPADFTADVLLGTGWAAALAQDVDEVMDDAKGIRVCATYAEMTALTADELTAGAIVYTRARSTEGDGGHGSWRIVAGTSTDNGGTVKNHDSLSFHFLRQFDGRNFEAAWFGCTVTLSNQATAINNAIAACGAAGGGNVWLPHATDARIGISSTIYIGDGSTSQVSTYNNVTLCGRGGESAINYDFDGPRAATTLVWVGSAAGRMLDIRGPVRGCGLKNLVLDGGGDASFGYRLASASFGTFENVAVYRVRERLRELSVVQIPDATLDSANFAYAIRSPSDNVFINCEFDGYTGVTSYAAVCDYWDGWDAANFDPVRNSSFNTKYIVNLNNNVSAGRAGVGLWLRFVDSNNWHDTWYQGLGTPSAPTTASWLYLEGVAVSGANYPIANSFTGKLQRGQSLKVTRDATSASPGGNMVVPIGEVDTEYVPKWPETKIINGYHPESVDSDAEINYFSEYGLQRIRDERRNQLLNSGFWRATRATTFSSPAASSYTLDGWVIDYDGTPVGLEVSQQAFTLGQTDVAWEPRYHARVVVASASGMTAFSFSQRLEDVRRFSGRSCCLSVWAKVSTGTIALTAKVDQDFGTGGSPSSNVVTNCNTEDASQTVTTTWQRFRFRFVVPSVSGKTLGSGGNDHTDIIFSLPLNSGFTLDLAEPQFEYGLTDSPWDRHSKDLTAEEALCARYLRSIPRTLNRIYNDFAVVSTANLLDSIVKYPAMRTAPALVVSGAASDYQIRDYAGNNGGNCDSSPTLVQVGTEAAVLRFTLTGHGLSAGTLGRQESGSSGLLLLSAEI